jgi:hypothetical protein
MFNYLSDMGNNLQSNNNSGLDIYWQDNIVLPYIQLQQIRGVDRECDYTGRPGFTNYYSTMPTTCLTTYQSYHYNHTTF